MMGVGAGKVNGPGNTRVRVKGMWRKRYNPKLLMGGAANAIRFEPGATRSKQIK